MMGPQYRNGMIVNHPSERSWGPGKILQVDGRKVKVHFRDDTANNPGAVQRRIDGSPAPAGASFGRPLTSRNAPRSRRLLDP